MDYSAFDTAKIDRYAAEARAKWGETEAYREFEKKTSGKTATQLRSAGEELMCIFTEFGAVRHLSPGSRGAQELVSKLQGFITDHYYTCTKQILLGLGRMYTAGDAMTDSIDTAGGRGTAEFVQKAIEIYCQ